MNRLILIGNGFDLAHGLKTSYHDFILDYLKGCIEKSCYSNRHFVGIRDYYEMWFDDNLLIKISSRSKPSNTIHQGKTLTFLDEIKTLNSVSEIINISKGNNVTISTNKSNSFSSNLLNECITKNWVDIESLYYEELKKCLKQYNKDKDYKGEATTGNLKHLNNQLDFIKDKLTDYLKKITANQNKKINQIADFFFDIRDSRTLFVNFNYTNTLSEYVTEYYKNFEVINIHGELNNPDNPIIFGYGDEVDKHYNEIEDLNENKFFKHIKSFDYFRTSNYTNLLRFIEVDEFEVYTMGHSLGLSDRTMLSTIFGHEKCKSIKIFYHIDYNDYRNKTYELSRHFNNKPSMREKIVPFPDCIPMPQALKPA